METHPTHPTRQPSPLRIDRTACPRWTAGHRDPHDHGTEGAERRGCRCEDARRQRRRRQKLRRHGSAPVTRNVVPSHGVQRRLQALAVIGWSNAAVAREIGLGERVLSRLRNEDHPAVHIRTRRTIVASYPRLAAQRGPSNSAAVRARAKGWAGPLDWHDIDDPHETATPAAEDIQFLDGGRLDDEFLDSPDTMALASVTAGGSWSGLRGVDQEAVVIALKATLTAAEIAVHARAPESEIETILDRLRRRDRKARARQNRAAVPAGSDTGTRTEPAA